MNYSNYVSPFQICQKEMEKMTRMIISFPICCLWRNCSSELRYHAVFEQKTLYCMRSKKKRNNEIFRPDLFNRPIKKPSSPTPLLCPVSPPPPLVISSLRLPTTHPPSNMLFVNKTRNLNGGEWWWWPPPPLLPSC